MIIRRLVHALDVLLLLVLLESGFEFFSKRSLRAHLKNGLKQGVLFGESLRALPLHPEKLESQSP